MDPWYFQCCSVTAWKVLRWFCDSPGIMHPWLVRWMWCWCRNAAEGLRRLEGVNISKGRVRAEGMEWSHVAVENIAEQWRMLRMNFYVTLSLVDHSVVLPALKNAKWIISKSSQILKILRFAWLLSLIPFSFPESIEILPSSITSPKYSTFVWLNLHLVGFRNRSLSRKVGVVHFLRSHVVRLWHVPKWKVHTH